MGQLNQMYSRRFRHCLFLTLILFIVGILLCSGDVQALDLQVAGPEGESVANYRWQIEEDATYRVNPGVPDPNTLALSFHTSYMPVVAKGRGPIPVDITFDSDKYYYVSILPDGDYTIGGASFKGDQASVTVTVNSFPLPTAQITVFVFQDNFPINNAPDLPEETGLAGFSVVLADAGGRYGQVGGQMMMDAFGNPIGTTYQQDAAGNFLKDLNGDPIPLSMGTGIIKTDSEGMATIKYLHPGKYGVQVVPPPGQGWVQTTTIEGTKTIDAWVKANEPPYFTEFGPPGQHVFIGFVKPTYNATVLNGTNTISGQIVNLHLSRPPDFAFYNGAPFGHTTPWVGLNLAAGVGPGIYAQPTDDEGNFSIPNVPPGTYQLVVWDSNLDLIIALLGVTVAGDGGVIDLGEVPVFQWFTRQEHYVFYDENENGMMDEGEGIPEQAVNLRFRDGTLYQSFPTDMDGFVPFDEIFPFFNWQVAEVDFARFKATGVTVVVDAGGPIDPTQDPDWTFGGILNPQSQPDNGGLPYRTETGPVLTQAFQGFLGQTSVFMWRKEAYEPGENGGISGIVYYATTRAENDPRYAAAEPWEPGIPRVQVNLYQDSDGDKAIDDLGDEDLVPTPADVDNYPFDRPGRPFPQAEDIDRNDNDVFDFGDAIQIAYTDSWDDNLPSGCPGDPTDPFFLGGKGYDGMRCWNQVRPGVFDGGYAFASYFPGGMESGSAEVEGLLPGTYIVEAAPPRGPFGHETYQIVQEEDKNVDFGDVYTPSPLVLPPICVGDPHPVPDFLTLFPGIPAPFAGDSRPGADRKQITLTDCKNAAVDFFMFTEVPIAGHIAGMILDDTANEFDPNSPQFGEKYAPPWMPVSIRDWTGREISRVYSDEWGRYNALVPSTFTADRPIPSGMAPNMITVVLNDPNMLDSFGQIVPDPFFNAQYSQFSYTFQYMPGTTTYLDTPVVPVAAFAGPDQFPLDCEFPNGTPKIFSVSGPEGGPFVRLTGQQITIVSEGAAVPVPNPEYAGPAGTAPKTIKRDYSFGGTTGSVTVNGVPLRNVNWTAESITGTIAPGTRTGQLQITRGDNGKSTVVGVTVTVGNVRRHHVPAGESIQSVIDDPGTRAGDLILVPPGEYRELVIMWKPVKLQGWGAGSTTINAVKVPAEKLLAWRQRIEQLITDGLVDLLPAQEIGFGGIEPVTLFNEEGPGLIVLARDVPRSAGGFGIAGGEPNSRIDGFTITGADHAGGIIVNGYAHYLPISNNRIIGNQGILSGGIRIGHPLLTLETPQGLVYQDAENDNTNIHHNHITQNGGLGGAGGGIAIHTGSHNYRITNNAICGNFTLGEGAGIGHLGLSNNGLIEDNTILFNQSFNQGQTVSGGGILIAGAAPLNGPADLSPGSGSVQIISNLIQGNQAGAGDGGGIRTSRVNGRDVDNNGNNVNTWYRVDILNNMIVNNMAALAGGAISMQDTARIRIIHNTIVNNDSVGTAGEAFTPGIPNQSNPQPAGIVSRAHTPALAAQFGNAGSVQPLRVFSNPQLVNNIIWHNRSFYFAVVETPTGPLYRLIPDLAADPPDAPVYWDLGVLGTAAPQALDPRFCLLTDSTGYHASNITATDVEFVAEYVNGARNSVVLPETTTAIQVAPAFDEGGNFINVRFGPLTTIDPSTGLPFGDYHINTGSPAQNAGTASILFPAIRLDYDNNTRPVGRPDIGADEIQ